MRDSRSRLLFVVDAFARVEFFPPLPLSVRLAASSWRTHVWTGELVPSNERRPEPAQGRNEEEEEKQTKGNSA